MGESSPSDDKGREPPPKATSTLEDDLEYLSEVSRGGERTFAVILLICAYSLLTMGNTTDASLVTNSAMSQLPIINVEVPIVGFYFLMPTLLLGAFVYLHLYLFRLWRGLAKLPVTDPKHGRLDDYIRPWLIATGFVRSRIPELRNPEEPFGRVESAVSIFLAWWFVPVTMFSFTVRYLARHDRFGSAYQIMLLLVVIAAAVLSFIYSSRILQARIRSSTSAPWPRRALAEIRSFEVAASLFLLAAACVVAVFVVFIIKGSVVVANLEDTELSRKSPGWTGQCETSDCARLDAEIGAVRGAFLGAGDLRDARASRVFLVNADLQSADLRSAVLVDSRFQGAKLQNVRMDDARLARVYFDHADLSDAHLDGALLSGARLTGVKAQGASFKGAKMAGAVLDRSDLKGAKFPDAHLYGASLVEAVLYNAQFQRATLASAHFTKAYLFRADMSGARLQLADLSEIVAGDIVLRCADLLEANLSEAYMSRADLSGASLVAATLRNAKLGGAKLAGANMDRTDLAGANLSGADLRGVNLATARGLTQVQLDKACTDRDTKLPGGMVGQQCPNAEDTKPTVPDCTG